MRRRLPTIFILMTVMIDAMGIGLILPVMPALILEVEGGSLARAALWGGVLSTAFAVMQFLFGPVMGNLSDRFGRRPVLLISLFVMAIDYVVMALAGSIWLLLLGRIVGGITGATHSTASAFMADISPPEKRGAGFGMVSAAFGLGFVLGPVIGGVLGDLGTRAPFHAAAALAFANFLFGLVILPETVTPDKRRPFIWRRANPFGAVRQIRALPGMGRLLTVLLLYQLATHVYPAIWAYFTQARFGWDPRMIGLSLAVFGISMAVVQGGVIRLALSRLGELRTVVLGFGFSILAFPVLAFINNGPLALILTPVAAMAAMAVPALQAMMSQQTPDDAQGELQGILTSVNALAMILSPLLMTGVFAAATMPGGAIYLPGAPFLAALLLTLSALVLFLTARRPVSAP
ncbi:tetracycline resistance MFS efflux pump [Roseovarius indicus]|nr:tetracycline resistance MFS efflux pump [Roseovarius indicus]